MTMFNPIIRMDENAYRGPEKMQSTVTISGFKAPQKGTKPPPVVRRKPLCDVTNSNKPRAQEKSSKKNCIENLSSVKKEQDHNFGLGEGFLHNHDECIKAKRQSAAMSFDYFMETVGLKRDSTPEFTPSLPWLSKASELEIEDTLMVLDEMAIEPIEIFAPQSPVAPRPPGSPCWSTDLELSPLKLKESLKLQRSGYT